MYELLDKLSFKCRTFRNGRRLVTGLFLVDDNDTLLYTKEVWESDNKCDIYFLFSVPVLYWRLGSFETVYRSINLSKKTVYSNNNINLKSKVYDIYVTLTKVDSNSVHINSPWECIRDIKEKVNYSNIEYGKHKQPHKGDCIDLNRVRYTSNNMESFLREYFKSELRDIRLKHILSKPKIRKGV